MSIHSQYERTKCNTSGLSGIYRKVGGEESGRGRRGKESGGRSKGRS